MAGWRTAAEARTAENSEINREFFEGGSILAWGRADLP